jgi:hypothetical protein
MPYNSQKEQMWVKLSMLSRKGSTRRSITSHAAYDKVCQAFYQAENYPLPYKPSTDAKEFLAESNVWLYYGEFAFADYLDRIVDSPSRREHAFSWPRPTIANTISTNSTISLRNASRASS